MAVLPTQYFFSSRNLKHVFWIAFFPSKTLLQNLAAIWVVALEYYNCVFPKVKMCGSLHIDISCDITTNTKRINKFHENKIFTNNIYLHLMETFFKLSAPFCLCIIHWSWYWVSKLEFIRFQESFKEELPLFLLLYSDYNHLLKWWLNISYYLFPQNWKKQYLNPISGIKPFQTSWVHKIYH